MRVPNKQPQCYSCVSYRLERDFDVYTRRSSMLLNGSGTGVSNEGLLTYAITV